jgi:hypothetical protein
VPVLVALGLVRAIALLRRGTGATWREAIGAFFIWQSTALVVARASLQGLFRRKAAFLRTPKTGETTGWRQAIQANWAETSLALLGLLAIVTSLTQVHGYSGPLVAGLLAFPTLGLAAAPVNSLAARRAALPADLGQRRRTEWLRDRTLVRGAAIGGLATVFAGVAAVVALLLLPAPQPVQPPQLFGPRPTTPSIPVSPAPSPSGTPGAGTPTPRSTGPAGGTTGTPTGTATSSAAPSTTPAGTTTTSPSPATTSTPVSTTAGSSPANAPATSAPATSAPATNAPTP